jgi:hypothetical protein
MKAQILRVPGHEPEMSPFAWGFFALGIEADLGVHAEWSADYDLCVFSGGPYRYGGKNQLLMQRCKQAGMPYLVVEKGWFTGDSYRIGIGSNTWLPEDVNYVPDRAAKLGLIPRYFPQGEKILIAGQGPYHRPWIESRIHELKRHTDREIVFRPHPNIPMHIKNIPTSSNDLDRDLYEAFCVVTHSSTVGIHALVHGRPVVCSEDAFFHCMGETEAKWIDSLYPPPFEEVEQFLNRYVHSLYTPYEIRMGEVLPFYLDLLGGESV